MSQKLTREQAFAHAAALLPIVAITGTSDGYSHGWTHMPRLMRHGKLWTAEGKGHCHFIGHDNIDWQTDDLAKRIYVPEVVPTDEDAKNRPWVMVRDINSEPWSGPIKLLAVTEGFVGVFITRFTSHNFCRFATAAEIATVEAKP